AGIRKNSPDSMDCEIRTMSCGTTRPAPRFRWPTSLLPICPSGRPTASPDASSNVRVARSHRRCQTGVRPSSMALPSRPGRNPQPSSTTRTTGVRVLRLVVILKGMQVSQIRSEEHTSELQSRGHLVCRLLLEKKKIEEYGKWRCKVL